MLDFGPTFIWVIVNLLILYFVLKKVLFKPVTKMMDDRTNKIKGDLDSAEKAKSEAAKLKQEYEEQIKNARAEAAGILEEANSRAEKEYDRIIASAKEDAARLLDKAREQIDNERAQMLKGVRGQVAGLALAAASKVLEANVDNEANRKLVDKFIDEAGAA